jgi:hypothetical protein
MTRGADAERRVIERLQAALSSPYALYPNVHWTASAAPGQAAQEGEADVVIVHPELGLLVVEVKDGIPSRDARGRWFLGTLALKESPFGQAEDNQHELARAVMAQAGWRSGSQPRAGHAVAFPSVDLASLGPGHVLGMDAHRRIVLDAQALETVAATRAWVEGAYEFYLGGGRSSDPLGEAGMRIVAELLSPEVDLHRLTRGRILDDRPTLLAATMQQRSVLSQTRSRRVEVIGPAGSGKSMLAAEKARRLAKDGYRTLLVCYNQPLASSLRRELADDIAAAEGRGGLHVATFHRLAEVLATNAGLLEPHGPTLPDGWFAALPCLLEQAVERLPGQRFHAIVVDEGQDFEADWLLALEQLLFDPDEGVLWVFHDPGQALRGPDVVHQLGLPSTVYLYENLRNPPSVAALAARFYTGVEAISDQRELLEGEGDGTPRFSVIAARPGRETTEAVRRELHRLHVVEKVRAWEMAVLSGSSAGRSEVWKTRRFGSVELWNGAIRADGTSLGLPPEDVPDEPADDAAVLFETIRRFKGLERPVVILCELPTDGARLNELLYCALTRPTTELVVIAPTELAKRLRG